ncbi:hypothetical protein LJ655_11365 [Paraburkholderia sp. MMS20-SJTN17]|uniref:Lipoprotein n=1 Tax=Paraburkholderia translucens TaxID=2886945 RepID=A0ABS8KCJ5_9BURK|nr:hypothetical protein [Paraburkholderia sp. MMS20-SJTN17]MCC8402480.1 hypothetical protein [Paraburkholderia sp. MMS20-SJTN17]
MRSQIVGLGNGMAGALTLVLSGCVYYGPYSYYPGVGGYYSCTSATAESTAGNGPTPASGTASANATPNDLPSSGENCTYVAVPPPAYYGYPGYYGYYGYPGYYAYPYGYPWPGYYGWWGPSVVIGGYWGGGYRHGGYYGHWHGHGGHWH